MMARLGEKMWPDTQTSKKNYRGVVGIKRISITEIHAVGNRASHWPKVAWEGRGAEN